MVLFLSTAANGQLITVCDEMYHRILARFNIALDVVDATFAYLLMYLKSVIEPTESRWFYKSLRYEVNRSTTL
ncbi:hypothetical protein PHYSODRAFT_525044 [Phytophthora sojae]|uniref:Uncharacterized protein n=1 Tax=Phytophthora sojae (strain P6497) TaxID=1094619 RepID=G5A600_PHYSP|nr:hypothetical protein PHYSODRAFT_525044 [Phytophthora sojae]EGZ08755.1 hypothetical protein PHYSODRAFT_525044 [Phytophthora sojae]|eukprot:XP_009535388.1 hypothetical protein PHYSODRAFT_525044 [Phytophthora sojae]